jgi:phosphatidate phosphatase APP1
MPPRMSHKGVCMRALSLCLVACSLAAWAADASPTILLFPAVGRRDEVTVSGRVLKESPHGKHALARNLRELTAEKWEGAPVELTLEGQTLKQTSSNEGDFTATFRFKEHPLEAGMHRVEACVPGATGTIGVQLLDDAAPFLLVSDLDDTLSVTNVLHKDKLARAALLEEGDTQPAVPGMAELYQCLLADKPIKPGIALVTGTPIQYVPRTLVFLNTHSFPFMGVYPRELSAATLNDYKQPVIRKLFRQLPHKSICVGDSGEHDPEVYSQMRKEFPDRILSIYIHDVGRDEDPKRFEGMFVFKAARDAARDALSKGYLTQACFEREFPTQVPPP